MNPPSSFNTIEITIPSTMSIESAFQTSFEEIRMQGGEPQKRDKNHNAEVWLDAVNEGPDFKPDIRSRPKRQAFLNAQKDMVYRVQKKRRLKKSSGDGRKMPFKEAVFWTVIELEEAEITEEFIKATAKPFEERSAREHEVINIYWRLGYSMDSVLGFVNSEVTQRHLESRMYGMTLWSGNKPKESKASALAKDEARTQQSKHTKHKPPKLLFSGSEC